MPKMKFNYEAPRWTKTKTAIEQMALLLDLDCKVIVSKGLLTEYGVVVCEGSEGKLLQFKKKFEYLFNLVNYFLCFLKVIIKFVLERSNIIVMLILYFFEFLFKFHSLFYQFLFLL